MSRFSAARATSLCTPFARGGRIDFDAAPHQVAAGFLEVLDALGEGFEGRLLLGPDLPLQFGDGIAEPVVVGDQAGRNNAGGRSIRRIGQGPRIHHGRIDQRIDAFDLPGAVETGAEFAGQGRMAAGGR